MRLLLIPSRARGMATEIGKDSACATARIPTYNELLQGSLARSGFDGLLFTAGFHLFRQIVTCCDLAERDMS